jgi:carboxymethylenebutenolidase
MRQRLAFRSHAIRKDTRMQLLRALVLGATLTLIANACATTDQAQSTVDRVAAEHAGDKPVPAAAAAGPAAQGVLTQTVIYGRSDGQPLQGFIAWPEAAEKAVPAVIVIHEWWGLNDNIKEMTRKLAAEGYVALAVDLYGGHVADQPEQARALMHKALSDESAYQNNLRQAYEFLHTSAQAPRIASVGWCFGGGMSLQTALLLPDKLAAAVIYYGMLVQDRDRLARLDVPLLGLFAERDSSIPPADVERFEHTLKDLGKSIDVHIYPGADHAFANPSGTRYDAAAAADAWKRTLAFLHAHLD